MEFGKNSMGHNWIDSFVYDFVLVYPSNIDRDSCCDSFICDTRDGNILIFVVLINHIYFLAN